jgi:deoxycytidylate deaminase
MDEPVPTWLWDLWDNMQSNPDVMVVGHVQKDTSYHWDGKTLTVKSGKTAAPGCTVVSHAERNGIAFAAREGIRLGGTDVFCTHAPCEDCAKSLLSAGIERLTYRTPYRLTAGVELLISAGIPVIDLSTEV